MMTQDQLQPGKRVECLWTMRASKAYAKYGAPARAGDIGTITKVNDLRDVMIVQFRTTDNRDVCCHVQNLTGQ